MVVKNGNMIFLTLHSHLFIATYFDKELFKVALLDLVCGKMHPKCPGLLVSNVNEKRISCHPHIIVPMLPSPPMLLFSCYSHPYAAVPSPCCCCPHIIIPMSLSSRCCTHTAVAPCCWPHATIPHAAIVHTLSSPHHCSHTAIPPCYCHLHVVILSPCCHCPNVVIPTLSSACSCFHNPTPLMLSSPLPPPPW